MINPFLPTVIRTATEADWPFIFSSWLESYSDSSWARGLRRSPHLASYARVLDTDRAKPNVYWPLHRMAIAACLRRPTTLTPVACFNEDESQILGWACGEPSRDLLHYVLVRHEKEYRKNGLAKALVLAMHGRLENIVATHANDADRWLPVGWEYAPLAFFEEETHGKEK